MPTSARDLLRKRLNEPRSNGIGKAAPDLVELGVTGLKQYGGFLTEEWLQEVQGTKGIRAWREMGDNSLVVAALLFAIKMLARQAAIRVEPADESRKAQQAADLVETGLDDMSQSWADNLTEFLSMLQYGFSWHEVVYKFRRGTNREPGRASQHTDGLVGWRKMPIRAQDTLNRWVFDDHGGIKAFEQTAPPTYKPVEIPISRSLVFRPEAYKQNPEGRSILRSAWRSYYFVKRIEEVEGIGIHRDLAGYPVVSVPGAIIMENKAAYTDWKEFVTAILRDEQEGAVIPSDLWPNTSERQYKLELLSAPSRRQFDTSAVIQRYNKLIAMSVLADFLFLGQDKVGSYALADTKTNLFMVALSTWLDSIAAVFNRHAIPRLMALNGFALERSPTLVFGDIDQPDPQVWADFLSKLAAAGFNLAGDPEIEQWIRRLFNLPEMSDETKELLAEAERQRQEARDAATERVAAEEFDATRQGMAEGAPVMDDDEEEE